MTNCLAYYPVYDCHPDDWDSSKPIAYATDHKAAFNILARHYKGTQWTRLPNPMVCEAERKGHYAEGWFDMIGPECKPQ